MKLKEQRVVAVEEYEQINIEMWLSKQEKLCFTDADSNTTNKLFYPFAR